MKRIIYALLILLTTSLFAQKNEKNEPNIYIQEGKIVVKLKPGFSLETNSGARGGEDFIPVGFKHTIKKPFKRSMLARVDQKSTIDFSRYYEVIFDKSISVDQALNYFNTIDGVEYAEPKYLYETHYTPNDPGLAEQRYLNIIGAQEAWDITQGSSDIVVAVIDAGVDYEHSDLDDNLYLNEDEIPDNGIDDDNDGYVDNYKGWDFAGSDFEDIVQDNDPIAKEDNIAHGTWVAGCMAAEADNGEGIAGVGFNTSYMALKCSADNDERSNGRGFILNSIEAVIYAAEQGADVINMSYGGTGYSQFAQDVMEMAALDYDVVLIASAGNAGTDEINYPAGYEYVVSVGATNDDDIKANFSSFGTWVDISAPGVAIFTTSPKQSFGSVQGTSFSGPIVAGAAALLRAQYPDYNQFQIRGLLLASGDDLNEVNPDFENQLGKRLNIPNALNAVTPVFSLRDAKATNATGAIPAAGETASLDFTFVNELDPTSANAYIKIDTINGNEFLIENDSIGIASLSDSLEVSFSLDLAAEIGFNTRLDYIVTIVDPDFNLEQVFFESFVVNPLVTGARVVPYLLADGGDFESNPDDFRSGSLGGELNVWEYGAPTNSLNVLSSGSNAWKTDLDANVPIGDYISALQTPVFDISDTTRAYEINFKKSMETERLDAPYAVWVEYSTDQLNWQKLGSFEDPRAENWYQTGIFSGVVGDGQGFIGNFENESTSYNISNLAGEDQVAFRFVFSMRNLQLNDGSQVEPLDGFMLDDFQLISKPATAEFTSNQRFAYKNAAIQFEYLSSGAVSYSWDFGDGATSSLKNPVHVFDASGEYDVTLEVDNGESTVSQTMRVFVLPRLEPNFAAEDGGDFEINQSYFQAQNVAGTGFELGQSEIEGKNGTASGQFAWVTGIDSAQYEDNSEAYLYTPEFDFSLVGTYTFNFSANFQFEDIWDGFIVEYTTDKGESWEKLNGEDTVKGWYNQISEPRAVFGPEVPFFSGSTTGEFEQFYTDVSSLSGQPSVAFRFTFLTDGATVEVGLAIDDFFITAPVEGPLEASFSDEGITGCVGQEVIFKSTSTGTITNITWDFGPNATPPNASGPGPHVVVYDEVGETIVTMTASNEADEQVVTRTVTTAELHSPTVEEQGLNSDGTITLRASDGDDFRWFFEDELIEGANEQTYNASERGFYTAEVSVGGCFRFATNVIEVITGLNDVTPFEFYPNPVQNKLSIDGAKFAKGVLKIRIYNLEGRIVKEIDTNNNSSLMEFSVSDLDKGLHVIIISDESKTYGAKLIKE